MSALSWNLQLVVREGRSNDFRALMTEMVESAKGEEGTLMYEWFVAEDGRTMHINERYADSDALLVHLGNFGSKFAERFGAFAELTSFSVYGEPSDAVRTALAPFGPLHCATYGGFARF